MCRAGEQSFSNETTSAQVPMTSLTSGSFSTSTSSTVAISTSCSLFAVATSSTSTLSYLKVDDTNQKKIKKNKNIVQFFDLPSCSPALTLTIPRNKKISNWTKKTKANGKSKKDISDSDTDSSSDSESGISKDTNEDNDAFPDSPDNYHQVEHNIKKLILCRDASSVNGEKNNKMSPPTHLITQHFSTKGSVNDIINSTDENGVENDTLIVWDISTAQMLHPINLPQDAIVHDFASATGEHQNSLLFVLVHIPLIQKYQVLEYDVLGGKLLRKIRVGSGSFNYHVSKNLSSSKLTCSKNGNFLAVKIFQNDNEEIKIVNRLNGRRVQKILLHNQTYNDEKKSTSGLNGSQKSNSEMCLMTFSNDGNFILVCYDDNCLNLFPIRPNSKHTSSPSNSLPQCKKSPISCKFDKITLLLDSDVRQRTSVVHMDMMTNDQNISTLITFADGTVCLFDNILHTILDQNLSNMEKTKMENSKNVCVTSTILAQSTTSKICKATYLDNHHLHFLFEGIEQGRRNQLQSSRYSSFLSHILPFRNTNDLKCSLKPKENISMRLGIGKDDCDDDELNHDRRGIKRKMDGVYDRKKTILGPDKYSGECPRIETMEQIQKNERSKIMRIQNGEKEQSYAQIKHNIPHMLLSKTKEETGHQISRINFNDRFLGMRQHFLRVRPKLSYNISKSTKEEAKILAIEQKPSTITQSTNTSEKNEVKQQMESLQLLQNTSNQSKRVEILVNLLKIAIPRESAIAASTSTAIHQSLKYNTFPSKYDTTKSKSTLLEAVMKEVNEFTLISQSISKLHPKQEFLPPLLNFILHWSQNFNSLHRTELASLTTRKLCSFWLKRILMEFMYEQEEDFGAVLKRVQQLIDKRLGCCKILLSLDGRIENLEDIFKDELKEK